MLQDNFWFIIRDKGPETILEKGNIQYLSKIMELCEGMKIIDISQEILSCDVYPGDPLPRVKRIMNIENGAEYNLSAFSMCAHNGTHVDAPAHFLKEGKTIEQMPLDAFVGMCYVAHHDGEVDAADAAYILKKAEQAGIKDKILIAGDAVILASAARIFAEAGIQLIGNESKSVGPEDAPMEVHKILLRKEIVLLEGIRLTDVSEGVYFLSALPLNIAGLEGAPCRAYLIKYGGLKRSEILKKICD